jgi:hypothetical protein
MKIRFQYPAFISSIEDNYVEIIVDINGKSHCITRPINLLNFNVCVNMNITVYGVEIANTKKLIFSKTIFRELSNQEKVLVSNL